MGKYLTNNISIRGYSHLLSDKECQDNSISWHDKRYSGVIICDGHGGEKYIRSQKGSLLACAVGQKAIDEYMSQKRRLDEGNFNEQFKFLESYIIDNWRKEIEKDFTDNPLENDERFNALSDSDKAALIKNPFKAYGSTFIAAVMAKTYYFVLKLGDGNVNVVLSDGSVKSVDGLEDEQLQFNVTTSLCQSNAALEFRHVYVKDESIKGLVLTTDGIINCFKSVESYHALIKNIYDAYSEVNNGQDVENARSELADGLNQLSVKGSGDDLSVAIAIK